MRTRCSVSSRVSSAWCVAASRGRGCMLSDTRAGSTAPTMPRHSAHACCPFLSLMLLACTDLHPCEQAQSATAIEACSSQDE